MEMWGWKGPEGNKYQSSELQPLTNEGWMYPHWIYGVRGDTRPSPSASMPPFGFQLFSRDVDDVHLQGSSLESCLFQSWFSS